jgi:hypothetical protein
LAKISGAKFKVKTRDDTAGIAVGTAGDFPALALVNEFQLLTSLGQASGNSGLANYNSNIATVHTTIFNNGTKMQRLLCMR